MDRAEQLAVHLRVLTTASAALAPVLDTIDAAIGGYGDAIVPDLADWLRIDLVIDGGVSPVLTTPAGEGDGRPAGRGGGAAVSDGTLASPPIPLDKIAFALAEGRMVRIDPVPGDDDGPYGDVAVVPVRSRGLSVGALVLARFRVSAKFDQADLDLASALASRLAVALERVDQHSATERAARDAARQAARLRRLMESAVVLGGAATERDVIVRLASAARRISGSGGAEVCVEPIGEDPIVERDGVLPGDRLVRTMYNAARQPIGRISVGRPQVEAEDFELALVALAQIGGALIENRRLVASLEQSRAELQALLDATPDAILEIDAAGRLTSASSASARVMGAPLPRRVRDVFVEPERFDALVAAASTSPESPRAELRARREGADAVLSVALAPIDRSAAGRLVVVLGDVTQQRATEEQLLRAQRLDAIGRMAGGIAHDFNNLVTAVIGFAQMASTRLEADDPVQEDLAEISAAGRRATELTAQLLAMGRGQVMELTAVRPVTLLRDLERMLRRLLPKAIALQVTVEAGTPTIRGDKGRLEQVLLNLALNARDAMPEGGSLVVHAAPTSDGAQCRLAVSDTGVGMPEDVAELCFEPFFTTKPVGQGTGLGLATAYGIVTQHEGELTVRSEPGVGTTFVLVLPAAEHDDNVTTDGPLLAPWNRAADAATTLLVVDDDPAVRSLAVRSLEAAGFRCTFAGSAAEALEVADRSSQLSLVVTDIVMPGQSGVELARRLRAARPDLPVLYMSGHAHGELPASELEGRTDFLAKPFAPAALVAAVRALLGANRQGAAQGSKR